MGSNPIGGSIWAARSFRPARFRPVRSPPPPTGGRGRRDKIAGGRGATWMHKCRGAKRAGVPGGRGSGAQARMARVVNDTRGLWRNGSASDSRSEGWEFESLCPHLLPSSQRHAMRAPAAAYWRRSSKGALWNSGRGGEALVEGLRLRP